jgi:hypothetical protein
LSTTNPTWLDPGLNPGRRGWKPATNRLSCGAALYILKHWHFLQMHTWLSYLVGSYVLFLYLRLYVHTVLCCGFRVTASAHKRRFSHWWCSAISLLSCVKTTRRTRLCGGKTLVLYSGGVWFESRPGHRLYSPRFFVVFLNLSRQLPGWYIDWAMTASLHILSNP